MGIENCSSFKSHLFLSKQHLSEEKLFLQSSSAITFIHTLRDQSNKRVGMPYSSLLKLLAWQHRSETDYLFCNCRQRTLIGTPTTKPSSCSASAPRQVQNDPFHLLPCLAFNLLLSLHSMFRLSMFCSCPKKWASKPHLPS